MKKYLTILKVLIISLSISFTSCTSLEEDPVGLLIPENFFSTIEDLDAGVVASLRPLLRGNSWDGLSVREWSLTAGADDLTSHRGYNKQRILDFDEFIVNSENVDNKLTWRSLYASIGAANLVIENKENVTTNIALRDQIVGQAYFIRAFAYYRAVRWWGDIPLVLTTSIEGTFDVSRTSTKEVYEQIIADAKAAESILPKTWSEIGRPTLGAAKTLLANVYLSMSGWPLKEDHLADAKLKAKEVMNLGVYSLQPSFGNLWFYDNRNNDEQIFNLQTARNLGTPFSTYTSLPYNQFEENGWNDYAAQPEFLAIFPDDERKFATFKEHFVVKRGGVVVDGVTIQKGDSVRWQDSRDKKPGIRKFSSSGTDARTHVGGALHPIFRYAEVLLIYAEVTGPTPEGYAAINKIRRRANGLDINTPNALIDLQIGLSVDDFRKEVIKERAWEFAFEGKRWHDLVRTETVESANNNHPFAGGVSKNNYLMPIPADEILINPNITQNTGY